MDGGDGEEEDGLLVREVRADAEMVCCLGGLGGEGVANPEVVAANPPLGLDLAPPPPPPFFFFFLAVSDEEEE